MPSLILCFMELLNEYGEYVTCRCTVRPQDVTAITPHVHHIVITSNLSCLLLLELYCRFIDEVIGIIYLMKYLLSWFSGTRSFSAVHNNVQQVVEFYNDLWWSLWWYMIYKKQLEKQLLLIHTYWVLHLIIDLSASTVRPHPDDPPRSFNWSVTNVFHAILCHSTSQLSPPICLASNWCVRRPCFSYEILEKPAVCSEYISGESRRVRRAFFITFRAVLVAVYNFFFFFTTVKMSQGVIGCCPAIAS